MEGMSRSNKHEAKFMAALCRYLILQGYEREQITVLTAYVGQLAQLKKELVPNDFFSGVRVCAVDNFQGEENDIILLSLVRSNEEGKIGFLQIENRVCVALSRAKKGFFCIGNISLLETKNTLWRDIIKDMRERGNVGKALMLMCQNHPKTVIHASCAEDFEKAPNGGCTIPCAERLECGHMCHMMCHPVDPEHLEYECQKPCTRTPCALNHNCPKRCFQECGPCMEPLEKTLPRCGHLQKVSCYECEDLSTVKCQTPCVKTWPCGHEIATKCHVDPLRTPCRAPCGVILKCEHPCAGKFDETMGPFIVYRIWEGYNFVSMDCPCDAQRKKNPGNCCQPPFKIDKTWIRLSNICYIISNKVYQLARTKLSIRTINIGLSKLLIFSLKTNLSYGC